MLGRLEEGKRRRLWSREGPLGPSDIAGLPYRRFSSQAATSLRLTRLERAGAFFRRGQTGSPRPSH